jgi:hypothetical protein
VRSHFGNRFGCDVLFQGFVVRHAAAMIIEAPGRAKKNNQGAQGTAHVPRPRNKDDVCGTGLYRFASLPDCGFTEDKAGSCTTAGSLKP